MGIMLNVRDIAFVNREFYHICNRGVDGKIIFCDTNDLNRFMLSMEVFNTLDPIGSIYEYSLLQAKQKEITKRKSSNLVDIICYCLNPNHYHMILQQSANSGVSEFAKRVGSGYAKYFNNKYKRKGILFQGKFRAVHIDSNEYLMHVSAYVNLNNKVHRIKGNMFRSSWDEYLNIGEDKCNKKVILNQFNNAEEYRDFAESSLRDILERKELQKELESLLLE